MSHDFLVYGAAGGAVGVLGVMGYMKSQNAGMMSMAGNSIGIWVRAAIYGVGMGFVSAVVLSYTPLANHDNPVAPFLVCAVIPPALTGMRYYTQTRATPGVAVSTEVPV